MVDFIKWVLCFIIVGWVGFPIVFYFFPQTSDKSFSISKIFGVLIWGYLFWISNIFSLISNSPIGAYFSFFVLVIISFIILVKIKSELIAWLRSNYRIVVFYEVVFVLAFLLWALVRAANPEIIGTEKPMELAFINGIYQSPSFPPNDPWLSGYAISYYYFGYAIVAMLMHALGTTAGVAFNLSIALIFSLVVVTSSGVFFNILTSLQKNEGNKNQKKYTKNKLLAYSLLAPLLILIVSNGAGLLEMLHSRGVFWEFDEIGVADSVFWRWLDIQELNQAPSAPYDWIPSRAGGTWWWRASRVLQDYTLDGQPREIIDEFPFFSFLLADLHPHLISLPFVVLNIYLCFYLFIYEKSDRFLRVSLKELLVDPLFWLIAIVLGSLIFINTWDFPIYFILICGSLVLSAYLHHGKIWFQIQRSLGFIISLGAACIFLFLPFILSFSSQAAGFIPSLVFRTRGVHFLVMFFPHIVLIVLLLARFGKHIFSLLFLRIFLFLLAGMTLLFLTSIVYLVALEKLPNLYIGLANLVGLSGIRNEQSLYLPFVNLLRIFGAQNSAELISASLTRLLRDPWVILFQTAVLSFGWYYFMNRGKTQSNETAVDFNRVFGFVLILVALAALLSVFPEFYYLQDQFGWRMNTIFKFYYQVWVLLSFASAYVVFEIINHQEKTYKIIGAMISVIIIISSLIYPFFAIRDKTNMFKNMEWSLNGNRFFELANPYEYEAVEFLLNMPYGVISEAVGGSYSEHARISRLTGYPTVLGWPGHQVQWRGGMDEIGNRQADVQDLYSSMDWERTRTILEMYEIDYVFIGNLERSTYALNEKKFEQNLTPIFTNPDVVIYLYNEAIK